MAVDRAEAAITQALVEAGRLEADRVEPHRATAAPARLVFRLAHHPAAHVLSARLFGQEHEIDEGETERRVPEHATDDLVRLRIGDEDGQRARIPVAGLLLV